MKRSAWSITPRFDLVPAREAGEDRQPGGVGRRSSRPAGGGSSGGSTSAPEPAVQPRARVAQVVQLVEPARAPVDEDRVPVACRVRAALDLDVLRDRVADAVGLVGVRERDARARRRARDDVERDPDRPAVPRARAEVRVDGRVEPDRADQLAPSRLPPAACRRAGSRRCSPERRDNAAPRAAVAPAPTPRSGVLRRARQRGPGAHSLLIGRHMTDTETTMEKAPLRGVLVVDDDADIRLLLEELLRGVGYAVRTAPDGREGLRVFHASPPISSSSISRCRSSTASRRSSACAT